MDRITRAQRSFIMSKIRGKNTQPEKKLTRLLRSHNLKIIKHSRLPGTPDIIIKGKKVAIFADGEFWHGKYFDKTKRKLQPYWRDKISTNIKRDRRNNQRLRRLGWHVLHFWDSDINMSPSKVISKIFRYIGKFKK